MTRTPRRAAVVLPVAVLLAVGHALPSAAAVDVIGASVYGDADPNNLVLTCAGGNLTAAGISGDACAGIKRIDVYPNDGTDTVDLSGVTGAAFPLLAQSYVDVEEATFPYDEDVVVGGPLNDSINGDYTDHLSGNAGDDLLIGGATTSGGLGDDTIAEFTGGTVATGGPGDDRFMQFLPLGGLEGGSGTDSLEIDFDRAGKGYGVDLLMRPAADTLFIQLGPDSANVLVSGVEVIDLVFLPREVQTYDGVAFPGISRIRGMGGVDVIAGGVQADRLDGGWGNDSLTGGGGIDDLIGGEGDDTISARDGVADRIDCGGGSDTVVADAADALVGCESVQLPPVAAPTPTPTPAPVVPETGAIKGKKAYAKPVVAKFGFTSPTAGATFQCKLDKGKWKACTSRHKVRTAKLSLGKHTLRVRAVLAGTVDATPSVKRFKVTR